MFCMLPRTGMRRPISANSCRSSSSVTMVSSVIPCNGSDGETGAFYFFKSPWSMPASCIERRLLN